MKMTCLLANVIRCRLLRCLEHRHSCQLVKCPSDYPGKVPDAAMKSIRSKKADPDGRAVKPSVSRLGPYQRGKTSEKPIKKNKSLQAGSPTSSNLVATAAFTTTTGGLTKDCHTHEIRVNEEAAEQDEQAQVAGLTQDTGTFRLVVRVATIQHGKSKWLTFVC
ncbi:unnamed protein product [Protopolystoma xenopodis]|uniref:Uncharacterized protein n=1 Tax=Protopolystoma xenopodis TaxID=117903 RepID=A0A3S5AK47_9PLAT|nr:unnamed protein product [Protopolystoma xenopodis]